jgi:hypothetical protein
MHKIATALVLVMACGVANAAYETRSDRHGMLVNVTPAGDGFRFDVTISDGAGTTIGSSQLTGKLGELVRGSLDAAGGEHVLLSVRRGVREVTAIADFRQRDVVVETMQTIWTAPPAIGGAARSMAPAAAVDPNAPLRVGGDVKAPTLIHRVDAAYPVDARKPVWPAS